MKKLLILFLLSTTPLLAQTHLKGSKILGVGVTGVYGGLQGSSGLIHLNVGKFLTNKFYIGSELTFQRKNIGERLSQVYGNIGSYSNTTETYHLISRSFSVGVNARYFLNNSKKIKPYAGLSLGAFHNYPKSESFSTINITQPYVKTQFGILRFLGSKERFYLDMSADLSGYGKVKTTANYIAKPTVRVGLNFGIGLRIK